MRYFSYIFLYLLYLPILVANHYESPIYNDQLRSRVWERIPDSTDVLVTHGPPQGIMDHNLRDERFGCVDLLRHVTRRVKPKIHIFGHAHAGYGSLDMHTRFYNVAVCNESYDPVNLPMEIEL